MEQSDNKIGLLKHIRTFIIGFTPFLIVYIVALIMGCMLGRKHPSNAVKEEWLSDVRSEVYKFHQHYTDAIAEYKLQSEVKDSIIYALKREIAKGDNAEIPIKVNINLNDGNDTAGLINK